MANKLEIMMEAERRGLPIPDDKKALLSEAKRRGLVKDTSSVSAPSKPPEVPAWGQKYPNLYGVAGAARETLGPIVEGLLMAGGAAGGLAGGGPLGGVAGAGLGYAGGKNLLEAIDVALGNTQGKTIKENVQELPKEIAAGEAMQTVGGLLGGAPIAKSMSTRGQIGEKGIESFNKSFAGKGFIGTGLDLGGKLIKQTLGASTGSGPGMIEEALKSRLGGKHSAFIEAMRGRKTGDEIVDNVRSAVQTLKDKRAVEYTGQLEKLTKNTDSIDISPVRNKLMQLLKQYGVKSSAPLSRNESANVLDFSRSSIGKSAQKDVQEITELIREWGTQKGDRSAIVLDTLKRRLDDFYSDSSQARQLVTALRNEVKNAIVKDVPQYAKMTKGYSDATRLIKDIEAGLMARKQGMTGRVTGDMTLRRLTSSLRENNEMRKELIDILGKESGEDIAGQVAGYSASQLIPRGLFGKLGAGSVGVLAYLNPKFWPLLAASSPRAVGEFMGVYGQALKQAKIAAPATYKTLGYESGKLLDNDTQDGK